ncbi:MAG: DUF362 domain-containing protein [Bacillota bacterium]
MSKPVVSVIKYDNAYDSVRKALELCEGLKDFGKQDKILIKPNLVAWDFDLPFTPYGVVTTSAVMFALVRILAEEGFTRITIGEGPLMIPKTIGQAMYKVLGYETLKQKYGVELVDFNEEKFEEVDFGDFKLDIAGKVMESDKVINVPVLKTHNQCKISLGIKNMKGVLNKKSKIFCHGKDRDLDHMFPVILEKIPVALTVTDGIFTLEKGPSNTGKAYRKDLIISSKDPLACDVAGAEIMGYNAPDIEHLSYYAARHGRSLKIDDIEVLGEKISDHRQFVDFDWEWTKDDTMPEGFEKRGISGLAVRKYDSTLCTGCSMLYNPMLILLMSAFKGEPFPNIEILSGKKQTASPGFDKTVLFGKCSCSMNKDNTNIKKAIQIKGCPPKLDDFISGLKEEGIECHMNAYIAYRHYLFSRYKKDDGFDMEFFSEQKV